MESIWRKTEKEMKAEGVGREPLKGEIRTEAAVIGAGLSGILTAWFLQSQGVKTVVLEAETLGSGQTELTTAKITSQHGLVYSKLIKTVGKERAAAYGKANQRAIEDYKKIVKAQGIDCFFERKPAYLYTMEAGRMQKKLEQEAETAASLGLPAFYTNKTEAEEDLPFSITGAVRFGNQAQFHPLLFLNALAKDLTVYEHTRAGKVTKNSLITEHGCVHADHIIFAGHYPFLLRPGYYFLRMYQERSYCLALKQAGLPKGMYLGMDSDGLSFREFQEYLILGGGKHRTGENPYGGKYGMLEQKAKEFWPVCTRAASWSAQDCMTLDGIPYIGQFSSNRPNWYVATGFGKWGMSSAMVSARMISDAVLGKDIGEFQVFSPQRLNVRGSAVNFMKNSIHAAKDLGKTLVYRPSDSIETLENGHGGIVTVNGEKTGAYKDENGRVYLVSVKCPHMGCQLEWNPDEKTWDCPCHGSRFHYDGTLLDGPAENGVDTHDELC